MEQYEEFEIEELPLGVPYFRKKVEDFLGACGLRLEDVDSYLAMCAPDGRIMAGGGLWRDVIKCVAVSPEARSEGLAAPLVSRLVSLAASKGIHRLSVYTKPSNQAVFESLGFHLAASSSSAILLTSFPCRRDASSDFEGPSADGASPSVGKVGVVVMNANPFTLGHRYLVEKASRMVEKLYVLVVEEDASEFSFEGRLEMVRRGCAGLANVEVLPGGFGVISRSVFPAYFLKEPSEAASVQMALDLDFFARNVAPVLGATVRFVGSEPSDPLTAQYNGMMRSILPSRGISVREIPRLTIKDICPSAPSGAFAAGAPSGTVVSASEVRRALAEGRFGLAAALTPASTHPYLLSALAGRALRTELDTPLKPGLVGPDSNGAHKDMDYALMLRGIQAIEPYFLKIASLPVEGEDSICPEPGELRKIGIEAEEAMMAATGGVNTHRGAIFALGLAVYAAAKSEVHAAGVELFMHFILREIAQDVLRNQLSDKELSATAKYAGAREVAKKYTGARAMAEGGYFELFEDWLPFYRAQKEGLAGRGAAELKTLLRIMSSLDDTCVLKRVGRTRAARVKTEAAAMLGKMLHDGPRKEEEFRKEELEEMCRRYAEEGISPGGAADMLALTVFMDSLLPEERRK